MAQGVRRNGRAVSAPPRRFPLPLARVGGDHGARRNKPRSAQRRQELARDAVEAPARAQAPIGLGLDSQAVRARMVQRLRDDGVRCEPVLRALASVPRHEFVDSALAAQAYEDTSLPIGLGQTISKPSMVARMLALLFEGRDAAASGSLGRVLEIGTGCGYQAALLALLAQQVVSVERLRPLHERARDNLAALRRNNLRLVYGDGRLGHAPNAPYDAIICAAGGDDVPSAWLEQMAVGGRLVAPTRGDAHAGHVLLVIDRTVEGWSRRSHEAVHFVPLRSGTA
jgi:protein-L-isoaspartate(D-aspartate) O-methyltransferase